MEGVSQNESRIQLEASIKAMLMDIKNDMDQKGQKDLQEIMKEIIESPGLTAIVGDNEIAPEQLQRCLKQGFERLKDLNDTQIGAVVNEVADSVADNIMDKKSLNNLIKNNQELANKLSKLQQKVDNKQNNGLSDIWKNMNTKKKVVTGVVLATIAPHLVLIALVIKVLKLGGMGIGKGAMIAGKATAHAAGVAGKKIESGVHKVKDGAIHLGEGVKHGFKNVADKVSLRGSNIENFLKRVNEPGIAAKDPRTVGFLQKFILQDGKDKVNVSANLSGGQNSINSTIEKDVNFKLDKDKIQAIKNVITPKGIQDIEGKIILTQQDLDKLVEKGTSTWKNQDDKSFKDLLNKFAPIMDQSVIQDKIADELNKITAEKLQAKTSEPQSRSTFYTDREVSRRNSQSSEQQGKL